MQKPVLPILSGALSTGKTVTSGASSANQAIPNNQGGASAKQVMLSCVSGNVHVKLGIDNTVAATADDMLIGTTPVVLFTYGAKYIAYIQETAASKLNIAPLES